MLLLATLLSILAALPLPRDKEKWLKVSSGEFVIYSNASDRATQKVATNLLRMREAVGKVTRLRVRSSLPVYVYVFRDERSFAPYRDAFFQRLSPNASGGFTSTDNGKFIILHSDPLGGMDAVIYHELAHHFVQNTMGSLPLWFSEGIAEYYSTFSVSGDHVYIGAPLKQHLSWLRNGELMPLSELFATENPSAQYYAQSWALVHYFLNGSPERLRQLTPFMTLLEQGKPVEEAFRIAFDATYEQMEQELRQYVRRPTMVYRRYSLNELTIAALPEPQVIPHDEVLYALGNLLANTNAATVGDGVTFLEEAVRLNPDHASAHATLGYAHLRLGKQAEANAAFEKAVALGTKAAQVYVLYGTAILPSDSKKARVLFERATQLDPASARAWAGLGEAYVREDSNHAEAIAALEKSLSLAAAQSDVAFRLVQLYARTGRRDDAVRLAKSEPARQALAYADMNRAQELLATGKREEAIALLRSVLAETKDEHLKENIRRNIHIDTLNTAISRANAGKTREAVKILDELIPQITDPSLKTDAEQLRADFAKRL